MSAVDNSKEGVSLLSNEHSYDFPTNKQQLPNSCR